MANFILLCAHIILILVFLVDLIDAAVLPVNNKEKEQINSTNDCFNKTNCHKNEQFVDMITCINDNNGINYGDTIEINNNCTYKQRSKTTAVLISIYFGVFGVDWFYLSRGNIGYILIGIIKLSFACGCCSGWPLLTLGTRRLSGVMIMIGYITSILFSLGSLIWWVIDWGRILTNKFPDGNGIELKHFSEYF